MRKVALALAAAAIAALSPSPSFADDDDCPLASLYEPELCPVGAAIASTIENVGEILGEVAELRKASAAAGAQIAGLRNAFFRQLDLGNRDTPEEQEFSQILFEKDVYYMSLYVAEGSVKGKNDAERVSKLGGGPIDGGIDPHASTRFGEWVDAIRRQFGAKNNEFVFILSPARFLAAIQATRREYQAYKRVRDKYELIHWQMSRRPTLPKPTTPGEMADQYVEATLGPTVIDNLSRLDGAAKREAEETALAWLAKLRKAIVDYESVELTVDNVAAALRAQGDAYTEQDIESFESAIGNLAETGKTEREARIAAAVGAIVQKHDRARRQFSVVNEDMIAIDLRTRVFAQTSGKLSESEAEAVSKDPKWKGIHDKLWYYSSGPGHEVKYGVSPYLVDRPYIVTRAHARQASANSRRPSETGSAAVADAGRRAGAVCGRASGGGAPPGGREKGGRTSQSRRGRRRWRLARRRGGPRSRGASMRRRTRRAGLRKRKGKTTKTGVSSSSRPSARSRKPRRNAWPRSGKGTPRSAPT